jgi:hypothetical protein
MGRSTCGRSTGLKIFGVGEWLQEKHSAKARRIWKKLILAVDADTGMIMASALTGNDVGDPSQVAPLLDQIEATIASVTADGAYHGMPTYDVVAGHGEEVRVIIRPHVTAVLNAEAGHSPSKRDQHILSIAAGGRLGWQKETDYGRLALVETTMGRHKAIIGLRLRALSLSGHQAEAAVGVVVLNRMLDAGRPDSVRRLNNAALFCWEEEKLDLCSIHATTLSRSEISKTSLWGAQFRCCLCAYQPNTSRKRAPAA